MSESSFDLSQFLPGTNAGAKHIAKGSKRPYTVIATAGESKLMINLSIEAIKNPAKPTEGCMAVVIRGMEQPSPHSEAGSKFPAWGYRDLGDAFGSRTHKRAYPVVTLPCTPQQLLEFWVESGFDDLICHRMIDLLQQDGHQSVAGIEGLKLITEELMQPIMDIKQPMVLDGKEIVSAD